MKLYQLIYVSKCNSRMSKFELEAILKQSRHFNGIQEITGMLVYDRGHFFQVLEGEYN
ncbi:MAG: BLUF domain-containing protein, partial [Planctomycetes bacterium]|nr:BLUF domain-containing protein [Planctomycetota bacterium]